jgi:hypothetical protein
MTKDEPTTRDFKDAGLPFEVFLRFASMNKRARAQATKLFWQTYADKIEQKRGKTS